MTFSKGFQQIALVTLVLGRGYGQTMIDARTQTRNIDFSGANSTRPVQTGSVLPASCSVGQLFFKTSAPVGANMYGCAAPNTWSLQSSSGNGGATMALQLGDFSVVAQNAATLAINSNCTPTTPCNVLVDGTTYSFTAASTAVISGGSGAGSATIYVSAAGALTLEYPSGITGLNVACTLCTALATAVPGIPSNAVPVAQVALSTSAGATSWSTITDRRAFLSSPAGGSTTSVSGRYRRGGHCELRRGQLRSQPRWVICRYPGGE